VEIQISKIGQPDPIIRPDQLPPCPSQFPLSPSNFGAQGGDSLQEGGDFTQEGDSPQEVPKLQPLVFQEGEASIPQELKIGPPGSLHPNRALISPLKAQFMKPILVQNHQSNPITMRVPLLKVRFNNNLLRMPMVPHP